MTTWPRFEIYSKDVLGRAFHMGSGVLKVVGVEWRLRLKARNGKVLCQGEGYKTRRAVLRGCEIINPNYPIIDVSEYD